VPTLVGEDSSRGGVGIAVWVVAGRVAVRVRLPLPARPNCGGAGAAKPRFTNPLRRSATRARGIAVYRDGGSIPDVASANRDCGHVAAAEAAARMRGWKLRRDPAL